MADTNFWIDLVAKLSKSKSKAQIKADAKGLGDLYVPLIGKLNKSKTKAQIKADLSSIDSTIDLNTKVNSKGVVQSVQQATKQAQKTSSANPIQMSFSIKKDKLINDLKILANQNSKMFKDANMTSKYNTLLDNAKLATSSKELSNLRMQMSAMRSEIKAINLSGLTLGDTFKKTFKRATELFTGTGAIMLTTQQLNQAWNEALTIDKTYTDLVKVQDSLSRSDYPDYLDRCNKKAQELATTQKGLIEGATEFSKSGYDLSTSNALSEKSTMLANVGEMQDSDAAKAIISGVQAYDIVDGYDDVINKAQALIDKYNEIGNTASITTGEIAEGVESVGSVMADANTSVDQFIALLSAGNRQFQDADSLALGLRTSALRIRGASADLEKAGEDADGVMSTLNNEKAIKALTGVDILEDDKETIRSIYDIYLDISKVYQSMSDVDQSALLDILAGKHRASAVSATLNNMSEAQEIYQNSLNSTGSAQKEYDKYLESSEASLNRFKSSMTETYQSVINGETAKGLLNSGNAALQFANDLGLVESTLKGLIAIGIVKAITTLSTAFKNSAISASNFGTALNTVKNMSTMTKGTTEYTNALNTLKAVSINLSDVQLKQVLANNALSQSERVRILMATGLKKSQAEAKLAEMGLTQATNAQTTANASATASTFSLSAAVKGFGASCKAIFLNNPIGLSIMALSVIIGAVSSKVSEYNQALEEARQKNIEASNTASEQATNLSNLYQQYSKLASIQNRTTSQEEDFQTAVVDITKALGDKATALEGLTAGTDEYTEALKGVTKAELEGLYATSVTGRKAAEEQLQKDSFSKWDGSHVTINLETQMTGVENHVKALETVRDLLSDFEDMGTYGEEWEPINWDKDHSNMDALVEYYNALIEARKTLIMEAQETNDDSLLDSDIYKNMDTVINSLSEDVDTYVNKKYEELKLEYEMQNVIPATVTEYRDMKQSLMDASDAGDYFNNAMSELLTNDFGDLASGVQDVSNSADSVESTVTSIEDLSTAVDSLRDSTDTLLSAANTLSDAFAEQADNGYISVDTMLKLVDAGYATALSFDAETGACTLNQDAVIALTEAKLAQMEADIELQQTGIIDDLKTQGVTASEAATGFLQLANAKMAAASVDVDSYTTEYNNLAAQEKAIENIKKNLSNITKGTYTSSKKSTTSSSKSSGSSSSKTTDTIKEAFDAEYQALQHAHNMELMSDEQYYSSVSALNDKYYKGNADHLDDYQKYQEEAYKGMKGVYKDYVDSNTKLLKAQLDAGKISYSDYATKVGDMLKEMYLSGKISAEDYFSYVEDKLENQLSIYERALKAVTKVFDDEIDSIDDSIDALNDKNDTLNDTKDNYDSILSVVDKVYSKEIDALKEQQDALQDKIDQINDEADALDLVKRKQEALYALRRAENQRSKLILKDGQFVYSNDKNAVKDAYSDLQDINNEEIIKKLEDEQNALQDSIDILEDYRSKWAEIADAYTNSINEQLAIAKWGEDYENVILQNRVSDISQFKDDYISIQQQITNNDDEISSLEEKKEMYQDLKDQWSSISDAYDDEMNLQYAAMLLGQNWESDVLSGRLDTLNNFKNNYIAIQQALADAAIASANAQVQAAQNAAAATTTASTSVSSGSGSRSGSGGSGSSSSTRPSTSTASSKYATYKTVGSGYRTEGQATSQIGMLNGNGVVQRGSLWYVYKKLKTYSTSGEASSKISSDGGVGIIKAKRGAYIGSGSSGLLDSIAKSLGEDTMVAAKEGERILTPVQNNMWEKWTNAMPDLMACIQPLSNFKPYDYANLVTNNSSAPISVSIGDIQLQGVNNVDTLGDEIVKNLGNVLSQKLNKLK